MRTLTRAIIATTLIIAAAFVIVGISLFDAIVETARDDMNFD